jgi:hypothetical protein
MTTYTDSNTRHHSYPNLPWPCVAPTPASMLHHSHVQNTRYQHVCTFYLGVSCAQADGQLTKHASDKVVECERVVALLVGTGPDISDELHQGLPQAPMCISHQGHEVVAARSITPLLGRLICVTTGSSTSISMGYGRAVRCGAQTRPSEAHSIWRAGGQVGVAKAAG